MPPHGQFPLSRLAILHTPSSQPGSETFALLQVPLALQTLAGLAVASTPEQCQSPSLFLHRHRLPSTFEEHSKFSGPVSRAAGRAASRALAVFRPTIISKPPPELFARQLVFCAASRLLALMVRLVPSASRSRSQNRPATSPTNTKQPAKMPAYAKTAHG